MKLIQGDCLEVLKTLPDNSADSVVTDPPYGWSFMGKKWDYDVPKVDVWKEVLRVLKPGAHALVACGTRTQHRMAVNLEDAGFEIRDIVAWVYGSGFPKSLNIGKAVDKLQGNEREVIGSETKAKPTFHSQNVGGEIQEIDNIELTKGNSPYEGWGTALKPAMELWTLCRKPLSEKTVAENVLKWGTGGINIDGCRIEPISEKDLKEIRSERPSKTSNANNYSLNHGGLEGLDRSNRQHITGRFPSNLIHDGSNEVVKLFPNTGKGNNGKPYIYAGKKYDNKNTSMFNGDKPQAPSNFNDGGSASRFFYCAKASKIERNYGLEAFEKKTTDDGRNKPIDNAFQRGKTLRRNNHPTVKPIRLMQYLCRLITPKNGTVLDPFMGSGTTGIACKKEGFDFVGIEIDEEYIKIAKERIKAISKYEKQKIAFLDKTPLP